VHFQTHPPKKVLIINTFGVGDVLFTTPLISNLKANYPELFIGYICNRRTAALLERNSKVDRIFVYERDEFLEVHQGSHIAFLKKFLIFFKAIKSEKFDLVLDVSLSRGTSFFTWAIGIKHRIGFNYKNRGIFLNKKIPLAGYEGKHVVDYYLGLLEELGRSRGVLEPILRAREGVQKRGLGSQQRERLLQKLRHPSEIAPAEVSLSEGRQGFVAVFDR